MMRRKAALTALVLFLFLLLMGASGDKRFDKLLQEGRLLFEEGNFEGAIDRLRSAIILGGPKKRMATAYMIVGISYLAMGGRREAESCFEFAIKLNPELQMPKGYPPKAVALFGKVQERLLGRLLLKTDPPEAEVYLDGKRIGRTDRRGEIEIYPVLIGRHRLELRKIHYHDHIGEIVVKSGTNTVKLSLRKIKIRLNLRSDPIGAEVLLNGRKVGETPINLEVEEDARPVLTVRYPTYREFSGDVRIEGNRVFLGDTAYPVRRFSASILIRLEKLPPGVLLVRSDPKGAEVHLDGRFVGITPLKLEKVEVGKHEISIFKDGFDRLYDEVKIESGRIAVYRGVLGGKVEVKSVPEGAEVILNGRRIGHTPLRSPQLPPGSYTVLIRKPGFRDIWSKVTVSTGRTAEIVGRLRPYIGALWISSDPKGASIFVDGRFSGRTPKLIYGLEVGEHDIRLKMGTASWSGKVKIRRNRIAYLAPHVR